MAVTTYYIEVHPNQGKLEAAVNAALADGGAVQGNPFVTPAGEWAQAIVPAAA